MMVMKRCGKPTCRELIDSTETYCKAHTNNDYTEYNKARNRDEKEYVSFYSSNDWRKVRRQALLRDEFLCQHCLCRNRTCVRTVMRCGKRARLKSTNRQDEITKVGST